MFFATLQDLETSCKTPVDILSTFLSGVNPLSNGWAVARCPLHDDSKQSFSVHLSSGNWKCFACNKTGSFFELPNCPTESQPTNVYHYSDNCVTKYVKVKYFPKTYRLFSVLEDGRLAPGMCGQEPILYNWNKIKAKEGEVYLVEGEKDAETLIQRGYLAVTNGSASNWSKKFAEQLKDRKVILIPDNDQAGRAWMHTVMDDLTPYSVLEIPDKEVKDVTDWVLKGNPLTALLPSKSLRVSPAAEIVDLSEQQLEPKKPEIWGSILPYKHTTIIYGDGGNGKSLFSLMLAYHVTAGKSFMGIPVMKSNTLYLDWELDKNEHLKRARQIAWGVGDKMLPTGFYYYRASADLLQILPNIRQAVEQKDIGLVIIDSLGPASPNDLNGSEVVIRLFNEIERLGVTALVIDHESKQMDGTESSKPFGSVYKYNLARSVLKIAKFEEVRNGGKFKLLQLKSNFGKLIDPVKFLVEFTDTSIAYSLCQ